MQEENQKDKRPEEEQPANAVNETTPVYLTADSSLQTPEEDRHDKTVAPTIDNSISVSNDDLHEMKADRYAGSDRAGTSERKSNSMDES